MALNSEIKQDQKAIAVTGFTGAAPQAVNGNTISMVSPNGSSDGIKPGTMSANVYAKATTNTLTITGKWQVSSDGTTFRDAKTPNAAAEVILVTGTGSVVSANVCVAAPDCVYGKLYSRFVLTSGVGVGGGAGTDEGSVSYNWRDNLY